MYFLKHTFACVLWFSDVQPTTHRVLAVLRSSQRLKPGRSRWENSLDMRTDGFPVPRTSAETEILKSLWVWNCVFWYFAEIPSHTLQSARWISTFFSPRMCWNVQAMSKDSAGAEAPAGKSAVAGRGLQLTPGVQKVGVHHQFMTFFVWQSKWTRDPESYRPQTIRLNRTLVRADGG